MFRWYDYHLKGVDTGVVDEPPITFHVEGETTPREGTRPVPEGTRWRRRFFRSFARLSTERGTGTGSPTSFTQDPPTVTSEAEGVRFRSPLFDRPTVVLGPSEVCVHAAIDAEGTNWIVLLREGDGPDEQLLARGYLKASHRAVDPDRSRPGQPYHPHRSPEPVTPGEVYEYRIGLPPIGHRFDVGDSLDVEIRSLEVPFRDSTLSRGGLHYHLPRSEPVTHRIYQDDERPSHVRYAEVPST